MSTLKVAIEKVANNFEAMISELEATLKHGPTQETGAIGSIKIQDRHKSPPQEMDCSRTWHKRLRSMEGTTPAAKECQHRSGNWLCLCCEDILCDGSANRHMREHYEQKDHCLAVSYRKKSPVVFCYSCVSSANFDQVIKRLQEFSSSPKDTTSFKLQKLDAVMVDVADLIAKPCPGYNNDNDNSVRAKPIDGKHAFAMAKEGLQKIFDQAGLEALANDQLQREFLTYLTYSAILISADSCPSELKADLSSFRDNLQVTTSRFNQIKNVLNVASDLAASISLKKFVLQLESSKYVEAKKELLASEEKIANLKASLATEETNKAKIDEALDLIKMQVTSDKDELVSDLSQLSGMEESVQAANQLLPQGQSIWNRLRTSLMKSA